ncbi:hypothetical protein GCM10009678_16090 [Actinomadura kijaniata]|uniref:Pimeloyl-ACP methyl ester carboxylesterase n=1 Tax=Actinomadura namibiensis TaxID=182080 RepID=A0A7W3QJ50_ACTNM|nr:hypothetical protein [Actinomadura namibiensis]MBA8948912.1 pimeloyl-ACP methyl ester carboxylesterase [Actinomadura namibiensis]
MHPSVPWAEGIARNVGPAGIEIAYERLGGPAGPPVLLIVGSGVQMVAWPDGFCAALVERGLHVVRFDDRDVGRSTHLRDVPAPGLRAAMSGGPPPAPYTLADMAADTVGLLDALGLGGAHLAGAAVRRGLHRGRPHRAAAVADRSRPGRPRRGRRVDRRRRGRATAAAIPGAELLVVEGMGHDLPRELWPTIADRVAALVRRAGSAP